MSEALLVAESVGKGAVVPVGEPLDVTVAHALAVDPVREPQEVLVQEAVVVPEALPVAEGVGRGAVVPVGEPLDVTVARALALDEPDGEGDPVKEPQEVLVREAVVAPPFGVEGPVLASMRWLPGGERRW